MSSPRTRGLIAGALLLSAAAGYVAQRRRPTRRFDAANTAPTAGPASVVRRKPASSEHRALVAPASVVRRTPASPEHRALVAPLTEGDTVGAWRLSAIDGPPDGWIHLAFTRGATTLTVIVSRLAGSSVRAPVEEGSYGLFYYGVTSLDGDALAVMRAVAARLRAHAALAIPPEMRPFTPSRGR